MPSMPSLFWKYLVFHFFILSRVICSLLCTPSGKIIKPSYWKSWRILVLALFLQAMGVMTVWGTVPSLLRTPYYVVQVCTTWMAITILLSKAKNCSYVYILRSTINIKVLWTHAIIVKWLRSQNLFGCFSFTEESNWQQPRNGVHRFSAVYEFSCWVWHRNNHLYLRPSHPDCSLLQDSPQTHHTILWPMAFKEK